MERERLGNGRYRVFLSDEELRDWGLSFERLSTSSPCTRALLSALFVAASEGETGTTGGIVAEVFPVEGGCFLLFSGEEEDTYPESGKNEPLCARFRDVDGLISFCKAATGLLPMESRLYQVKKELWLVLYPSTERAGQTAVTLSEWECFVKHGAPAAAFLEEHGSVICREGALERLNEAG